MYGIVNKAFQALVYERFGEDKWEEIMQKSGVDIDIFIGMEQYPDEITFKIVGAASEVLEVSV